MWRLCDYIVVAFSAILLFVTLCGLSCPWFVGWPKTGRRFDTSKFLESAVCNWWGAQGSLAGLELVLILACIQRSGQKYSPLLPVWLCWLNIPVTILLYLVTHLGFALMSFISYLIQITNSLQWGLDIIFTYGNMSTVMYQINISEC